MNSLLSKIITLSIISTGFCIPRNEREVGTYGAFGDDADLSNGLGNPEFTVPSDAFSIPVGSEVTFPCSAQNIGPFELLLKYVTPGGGDRILFVGGTSPGKPHPRIIVKDSSFILSDVKKGDKGNYICRFETNPPTELTHSLDVQYPPEVHRVTDEVQKVPQGGSVELECKGTGNPKPTITWSRKEGHLPTGVQTEQGLSLTLAEVDRHVEGTYICTASNGIGQPATESMMIQVAYPPEIVTEQTILHTGEGDEAKLVCYVHGRPIPTVQWMRGESLVSSDNHIMTHDGSHKHSLTILNIADRDFGHYTCVAKNKLGEAESTLRLTGVPKAPKVTSSPSGGERDTYTLTWFTESFANIRKYRLRLRKVQTGRHPNAKDTWDNDLIHDPLEGGMESSVTGTGTIQMRHPLMSLEQATDYEALISVENKFGWSHESEVFSFHTRKEVAVGHSANDSGIQSVISHGLIIFLSICIIFCGHAVS